MGGREIKGITWLERRFHQGDYTVEVSINDYLDIYCPHYEIPFPMDRMERYILYMVNYEGHDSCDHRQNGFKRWESATPPNLVDKPCLKLKVYVRPTNDSLYESPEPIFTSNNSCCSFTVPDAFFVVVPVFWTILTS
ncbi:hypothetical protein JD844_034058 [Phrynosoma platyrhinos]|uniref:Ephrin RBD domain-containing protein n=1 Tax=Phrynosoma platyrhinos TaxID=52577 RepID=A0ABQ7T869_PHRPL|nr:hypothetical protein JD844_034058 [Phrynosoma platyrhinos]